MAKKGREGERERQRERENKRGYESESGTSCIFNTSTTMHYQIRNTKIKKGRRQGMKESKTGRDGGNNDTNRKRHKKR